MNTQLDIPEDINKKLKIFRIEEGLKNKAQAIVMILREKFGLNKNEKTTTHKKP